MSKSNDPSGTAIRLIEHPGFAWLTRKAAVCATITQYRLSAELHQQFKDLGNYRLFRYEDLLTNPERRFAGAMRIHRNGVSRGNARAPERPA